MIYKIINYSLLKNFKLKILFMCKYKHSNTFFNIIFNEGKYTEINSNIITIKKDDLDFNCFYQQLNYLIKKICGEGRIRIKNKKLNKIRKIIFSTLYGQ